MNEKEHQKLKNDIGIAQGLLNEAQTAIGNWVDWLKRHADPEVWSAGFGEEPDESFVKDIFAYAAANDAYSTHAQIKIYSPFPLTEGQINLLASAIMTTKTDLLADAAKNAQVVRLTLGGGKYYLTGKLSRYQAGTAYLFTSNEGGPVVHFAPKDVSDACLSYDGHLVIRIR